MVTGSVLWYPSTLFPRLSPTRRTSIPAASSSRAVGKSYAVSMTMRRPVARADRISGTVTGRAGSPAAGTWLMAPSSSPPVRRLPPIPGRGTGSATAPDCRCRGTALRLGPSRSFGSEWDVVLHAPLHRLNLPEYLFQILPALHEIDVRRVDDQKRRPIVMEEEIVVGPVQLRDVLVGDLPLVVTLPALDPAHQHVVA